MNDTTLNENSLEQLIIAMRDTKHGAIPNNLIWSTALHPDGWTVEQSIGLPKYEVEVNFD